MYGGMYLVDIRTRAISKGSSGLGDKGSSDKIKTA
jgi:hypothetical protein